MERVYLKYYQVCKCRCRSVFLDHEQSYYIHLTPCFRNDEDHIGCLKEVIPSAVAKVGGARFPSADGRDALFTSEAS